MWSKILPKKGSRVVPVRLIKRRCQSSPYVNPMSSVRFPLMLSQNPEVQH